MATNNNGYFTRAKTKPPCVKDCADRTPDCHSKCSKYIEWKNGCEADKNTIEKHKQQEKVMADYVISITSINKQKRRRDY